MRTIRALTAVVALVCFAACGDGGDTTSEAAASTVTVKDFKFAPADLTVRSGESVRWENDDAFLHTITSGDTSGETNQPDGRFDKGLPDRGTSTTVRFDEPGTYSYYCKQHNAMNGTVTVT